MSAPNEPEETTVGNNERDHWFSRVPVSRRTAIQAGLATAGGVAGMAAFGAGESFATITAPKAAPVLPSMFNQAHPQVHLAATDGWVSIADPSKVGSIGSFWPDGLAPAPYDLYVFGFTEIPEGATQAEIDAIRGNTQTTAPLLGFDQDEDVYITLTNLGLAVRPDLTDGHSLHWHGFTNAIPIFDGVPELSVAVPIGRSFTYFYRPRDAGTFMYHCHFEDVEHVQMGMVGVVYVRPAAFNAANNGKFAYNHLSTRYDREFAFMLNEVWAEAHFRDAHIQATNWTDYEPSFWCMNGRVYPDTLESSGDPRSTSAAGWPGGQERLRYQPETSLVRGNTDERVLLRLANLGFQHHAMTLDGIPMSIIAKDASLLVSPDQTNLSTVTNTVEIGPGESRDVIVKLPSTITPDDGKPYQTFPLYDRNYAYLNNGGDPGYGGMRTEIRVFPAGTADELPTQTEANG